MHQQAACKRFTGRLYSYHLPIQRHSLPAHIQSRSQGLTDENQQHQQAHQSKKRGHTYPPRVQIVFGLTEQFAQAGFAAGHAQTQEIQTG